MMPLIEDNQFNALLCGQQLIRKDREIALVFLEQALDTGWNVNEIAARLGKKHMSDPSFLCQALKIDEGYYYLRDRFEEVVGRSFVNSKKKMMPLIEDDPSYVLLCSDRLVQRLVRQDREIARIFIMEAAECNYCFDYVVKTFGKKLMSDPEIALAFIKALGEDDEVLHEAEQRNPEFAEAMKKARNTGKRNGKK